MKLKLQLILLLLFLNLISYGQQNTSFEKWSWLIGEWKGDGSGKPGQ